MRVRPPISNHRFLLLAALCGLLGCGMDDAVEKTQVPGFSVTGGKGQTTDGGAVTTELDGGATVVAMDTHAPITEPDTKQQPTGPCQGDDGCPAAGFCLNGACLPDICKPGERKCNTLTSYATCKENGSGYTAANCKTGKMCDEGLCKDKLCTPNDKLCVDNKAVVCGARGVGYIKKIDCGTVSVCVAGKCTDATCKPGEAKCIDDSVVTCKNDGSGWSEEPCKQQEVCVQGKDATACYKQICKPKTKTCDQGKAVQCSEDGLALKTLADCNKLNDKGDTQQCLGAKCVPSGCNPGSTACDGEMLATCVKAGNGYSLEACDKGEVCDAGKCSKVICANGETICDDNKIQLCIGSGTAWAIKENCGKGLACAAKQGKATCSKQICTPKQVDCSKDNLGVSTCSKDGLSVKVESCGADKYCKGGKCHGQICTPKSIYCSAQWVMWCDAIGASADKNKECKGNTACKDGLCQSKKCEKGKSKCDDKGNLKVCADETKPPTTQSCGSGYICNDGKCGKQICKPSAVSCDGTKVLVCDNKGLSQFASYDCKQQGQTCADGKCATANCGNGKKEAGEECDDGNNNPDDGCTPQCKKTPPKGKQCQPSDACCKSDGTWEPKGNKCNNAVLSTKYKCSSDKKGAKIEKTQGYASCWGNTSLCNWSPAGYWWSNWKPHKECNKNQYCKLSPGGFGAWCQ